MSTGNSDGRLVVTHDFTQQFSSGQHGNASGSGSGKLGIIRMDSGSVDDHIDAWFDIVGSLSVEDSCSLLFQMSGQFGPLTVRT